MFSAIISAVVAYLLGSVPSGLIIGRLHGVDVRKVGSCNIGATNVTRTVGKGAGIVCFVCDFLKGALPVLLARYLDPRPGVWVAVCCCAVIGHMFPLYLKFKGGKGVATAAGGAFAIAPVPVLIALAVWAAVFEISRYVSLASIIAAAMLPLSALLLRLAGILKIDWLVIAVFALLGGLAIIRHKSNIQRLLNGTENRFERKK